VKVNGGYPGLSGDCGCSEVVGFTPALNGGTLSLKQVGLALAEESADPPGDAHRSSSTALIAFSRDRIVTGVTSAAAASCFCVTVAPWSFAAT
jgi:hypothetical protein